MRPGDLVWVHSCSTDQYFADHPGEIGEKNLLHSPIEQGTVGIALELYKVPNSIFNISYVRWLSTSGTVGWSYMMHLEVISETR
jgi:hypothetical protein